jgi:hypothetical protein
VHTKALEKIRNHLVGAVRNTVLHNSWPDFDSYRAHLDPLAEEVLKHKKKWVSYSDVYSIFLKHAYAAIASLGSENGRLNGPLLEILDNSRIDALVGTILGYIEGIPRTYDVYAPLPSIPGLASTVELTEKFGVHRLVSHKEYPGRLRATGLMGSIVDEIDPPRFFLRFESQGYCDGTFRSSASRSALGTLKIALQQTISREFFDRRKDTPRGLGILLRNDSFSVPKQHLLLVDPASEAISNIQVELPIEVCRLLDTHTLPEERANIADATAAGTLDKMLIAVLRSTVLLHLTRKPEALRVKSSMEWAFDAYVNEDPTMSFLQTCIALEALYGDGNDGENLTKTLADRCAYLISADIRGRATIRENFRALYSARSKIVHGSASSLAPEDEHHLKWGKSVLELSIFKEINHLSLGKL